MPRFCKIAVLTPVLAAVWSFGFGAEISTEDGLYFRFRDFTAEPLAFVNRNTPVDLHVTDKDYPSFRVIDAADANRSAAIPMRNTPVEDQPPAFEGTSKTAGITLRAVVEAKWNSVHYDLDIENIAGGERAVTIRYQLPVAAEGWLWWDDVATSRTIEAGQRYVRYDGKTLGTYPICWYPLGTISQTNGPHALTFAAPFTPETIPRVGYDGNFFIEFDVGLSPLTKTPDKARLSFLLFNSDAEWGFRSAVEKYYALHRPLFVKRVNREGTWVARTPTQKIDSPEDYCVTFHEVSTVMTNSVPFDNRSGIYALRYANPQWVRPNDVFVTKKATPGEVKTWIEEASSDPSDPGYKNAQYALAAATERPQGGIRVHVTKSNRFGPRYKTSIEINFDPEIPVEGGLNRYEAWERNVLPSLLSFREGRYDGQYIDSAEFLVDGMDCRRDHFQYADYPLGWDAATAQPGVPVAVSKFELLKAQSDVLHSVGQLMMSNFTPWRFGFYTTVFDINGSEVWEYDWAHLYKMALAHPEIVDSLKAAGVEDEGMEAFRREAERMGGETAKKMKITDWRREDLMYYRRFCSYQKPYLLLMKLMTVPEIIVFGEERFRQYMEWSLFFGHYPACSEAIWSAPRPFLDLYSKYIHVSRDIGSAGWEPVPHARTSAPEIRVERFGYSLQGTLHFTVRNFGDETRTFELRVDGKALNLPDDCRAVDAFSGEPWPSRMDGRSLVLGTTLDPKRTNVVHILVGPR